MFDSFWSFLSSILTALIIHGGPIGATLATVVVVALLGGLAYFFLFKNKKRKKKDELPSHADYLKLIKDTHDKHMTAVIQLNEKYHGIIAALNDKRIEDMRELATDYHQLASSVFSTLQKLIEQLGFKADSADFKSVEESEEDSNGTT